MGILRRTLAITGWTALGTAGAYVAWTRKNRILSVPASDPIFHTTLYARYNPSDFPVTQDLCLRRASLASIRPELLEDESKLVEAFCAGVWSGLGFAYQRSLLEKKFASDPATHDQLWSREELRASSYGLGTRVADHFEVVAKDAHSVVLRCGDSPRTGRGVPRDSDGLFAISAEVDSAAGEVEFGLKSVFFSGTGKTQGKPPMSPFVQWLHQQYDKVLMETAIGNCTR